MSNEQKADETRLRESLGLGGRRRRSAKWLILGLIVLAGAGLTLALRSGLGAPPAPSYRTAEASIGDLRMTVSATGTLEGLDTVEVGTEVSGRVIDVLVDFNERVKAGQVLARIDPEQLEARLEEARAQVQASEASVINARATEAENNARLERTRRLVERGLVARQELETVQAAAERAAASTRSALAQETVARASLRAAQTNAARAEVKAPIDGVVLSRAVEPGQTVAASFQAPVLFTLARDLTRMRLLVDVDEADVGRVREGQDANFTVEAWAGRSFQSKVLSVRNVPTVANNVVTYQALLAVDNAEQLLRPGMTATATIVTEQRTGVLTVPTAALRFTPSSAIAKNEPALMLPGMGRPPGGMGRPPGQGGGAPGAAAKNMRVVWTLAEAPGAVPERAEVEVGASDGRRTEILNGLGAGTRVVLDQMTGTP